MKWAPPRKRLSADEREALYERFADMGFLPFLPDPDRISA
jgi:hypothetical protein